MAKKQSTTKQKFVVLRDKIIALKKEQLELVYKLESTKAEVKRDMVLLNSMALDILIEEGHDPRNYTLIADTLEIEKVNSKY